MYIAKMKKVAVRGVVSDMVEGMRDWKVTYRNPEVRHIYIRADSEDGALSIAESIAVKEWTDDTDERGIGEYEVEEDG